MTSFSNSSTVYVVGRDHLVSEMFKDRGWLIVDNVSDADLVQFTGGPDVNPSLYGEKKHATTTFNPDRDSYEMVMFDMAVQEGKPMAGICRGGQFLHVMNGGKLYQDVDKHALLSTHKAVILDERLEADGRLEIDVTSTHHQMMDDSSCDVVLASWESTRKETDEGLVKDQNDYGWDVECAWHYETRSLCYQPHPEYCQKTHDCQKLYFEAIKTLCLLGGAK